VTLCAWEGNRRSDVAQAMRRRLQWIIHLSVRTEGLETGNDCLGLHDNLYFYLYLVTSFALEVMTINVTIIYNPYNHYEIDKVRKSP